MNIRTILVGQKQAAILSAVKGALLNRRTAIQMAKRRTDLSLPPSVIWPQNLYGDPRWTIVDYESYVSSGYQWNSLIYSAITYKARAQSTAALRVLQGSQDEANPVDDNHPLALLAKNPNRYQSQREFIMAMAISFNVAGNALIYIARDDEGTPRALYVLRPDWVHLMPGRPDENLIVSYIYTPRGVPVQDGKPILTEDIIHVKLPNPGDELHGAGMGLSPFAPVSRPGNVDNDVTRFLKKFFEKGAMFQNVVTFTNPINQKQADVARERLEEIYGGAGNWHKFAVLGDGATFNRVTPTFDEMGFESIDFRNEVRILGPFGVPPILAGARIGLDRATMSNYDEARRQCWEDTLLPELRMFEQKINRALAYDDIFLRFDTTDIPALQRNVVDLASAAGALIDRGVPARAAFDTVGLDVPAYEGDHIGYLNTIPVAAMTGTDMPEPQPALPSGEPDAETAKQLLPPDRDWLYMSGLLKETPKIDGGRKSPNHQKMNVKINALAQSWEERFAEAADAQFQAEQRHLDMLLHAAAAKARAERKSVDWDSVAYQMHDYYSGPAINEWRVRFRELIKGIMVASSLTWGEELGSDFDPSGLDSEQWFMRYMLTFADPITSTSEAALSLFLEQGRAEGWGIDKTARYMGQIFQQWREGDLSATDFEWLEQRMPVHRREMIVRTETIRASNAGSLGTAARMGATHKVWIATFDGRQRETHEAAHLAYHLGGEIGPIRLEEAFVIGGYNMQYPGDPSGPPEEFINCRCTVSFEFVD